MSLLPHNPRRDEALAHDTRIGIDENNLRRGTLNRPPTLFLELDAEGIESHGDNVVTIMIRRPKDGNIARVNLRLSASSDGNKVTAEVNTVGLERTVERHLQALFVWVEDENGDLDYPKGHPSSRQT